MHTLSLLHRRLILILICGFLVSSQVYGQGLRLPDLKVPRTPTGAGGGNVYTDASLGLIAEIANELGYPAEQASDTAVKIVLGDVNVFCFVKQGDIQLYAGFTDSSANLETVNEWNKNRRFSRSYLDNDGDPIIEADLDFDGGVTREGVRKFIQLFELSLQAFREEVVG
ncbi:MAG: YbjN domain-containing protein [Verrucomicrobiales bacterium]